MKNVCNKKEECRCVVSEFKTCRPCIAKWGLLGLALVVLGCCTFGSPAMAHDDDQYLANEVGEVKLPDTIFEREVYAVTIEGMDCLVLKYYSAITCDWSMKDKGDE